MRWLIFLFISRKHSLVCHGMPLKTNLDEIRGMDIRQVHVLYREVMLSKLTLSYSKKGSTN